MSFWKAVAEKPPGRILVTPTIQEPNDDHGSNVLSPGFLLGTIESHKAILGVDGSVSYMKPRAKPMSPRSVSSSGSQIHISSFQPNHHRVVSGQVSPASSIKAAPDCLSNSPRTSGTPSPILHPKSSKKVKVVAVLDAAIVDIDDLKKLAWGGLSPNQRALSWKLLMGYLPAARDRRDSVLLRKRKEYQILRQTLFEGTCPEDQDPELWHQITIDIPRTNPSLSLFQQPQIRQCLERILYCWSVRHPASSYVQGINDLATPFLATFLQEHLPEEQLAEDASDLDMISPQIWEEIEADTFWCFSKLLDGIQDNYTSGQRGIQRQLGLMKYLIGRIDKQLAAHIENESLHYVQFAFRWMNCLLMREFPFSHILRLWDAYMSESPNGFSDFHVYVCASFLVKWSPKLLKMEFQDMIMFLQRLPTEKWTFADIELLLSEAYMWHSLFHNAPSHLI
ncbi:GTPase-activating protein [Entomophthora muscae]|uniref:GTPase-activating protein n=1 Tax=Entomophthora muscae TaxID=34485 RepID=A0ACC2SZH3_9FUNG|nr:GTPase-activating protein [Entomophthora muscae]